MRLLLNKVYKILQQNKKKQLDRILIVCNQCDLNFYFLDTKINFQGKINPSQHEKKINANETKAEHLS